MKECVQKALEAVNGEILTYDGADMISDGIIDSFQVIDIVEELEKEFQIEIDAKYVIAENFANKNTILNLMEKIIEK